ncbi:MAG: hypothetical protein ACYTG4_13230 [Planctomycetota bacterium]|jgi:hypothetical protein
MADESGTPEAAGCWQTDRVLLQHYTVALAGIAVASILFIFPAGIVVFIGWLLWIRPAEQVRLSFASELEGIRERTRSANDDSSTDL